MGHFIRTAVEVIGVAVSIAAAIPSGGTSLLAGALSVSAATGAEIAAGVSLAAAGIEAITAKKPAQLGNPSAWQSDPQAGIPHVGGRMYTGGQIILRNTSGKDNNAQSIHTVYSTGPIKGYESLYVSSVATGVDANGNADIVDKGKLVVATQLGRQPEASAFGFWDSTPGLSAASKLSGLAVGAVRLYYDTKGGHTLTTEPQIGYVVLGTPVYDPRQDSTYPGGAANGTQRSNDETTWSFTGYDNPGLKALTWLIGYRQAGNLVIGAGIPIAAINVAQLVEMANVCDANGWKYACAVSSTDDPWDVYTKILQAGGAIPTRTGTITGAIVNTPKVSLATFERDDIIGPWSIQATQSRRDRINTIVPRYMAEQSLVDETTDANGNTVLQTLVNWGMAQAGAIQVADYVAFDGETRQKEVDYPFVTGVSSGDNAPNQVAQLARYDIENAREFGPISLPMKPRWMGYRAGDVITGGASLTELGLVGQDIMILQRQFSPANMTVTFTARSETKAKHAFALGQTTTAPPTPSLSGPPLVPVPGNAAWALTAGVISSTNGTTGAALFLKGTADSNAIDAVIVEMRVSTGEEDAAADWEGVTTLVPSFDGTLTITGVQDLTAYQVAVSYRMNNNTGSRLILGPAEAGQTSVPWQAGVTGAGKPQDNATVGAPNGTPVGSYADAAQLVSDLSFNTAEQADQLTRLTNLSQLVDFRTLINGQGVATAFGTFTVQQQSQNETFVNTLNTLGASINGGSAFQLNIDDVYVTPTESMSSRLSTISATIGTNTGEITSLQTVTGTDGGVQAKALFHLDVNGNVSGMEQTNNGQVSAVKFLVDQFQIVAPNGGSPQTVFSILNGVIYMPNIVVSQVAAGSITVNGIAVGLSSTQTFSPSADTAVSASEQTILEQKGVVIGDATAGQAIITISGWQDGTGTKDAGSLLKVYIDTGSGYSAVRQQTIGARTSGGDTYAALPFSMQLTASAKVPINIKFTVAGANIAGGGNVAGHYIRNVEVDVMKIAR